MTAEIGIMNKSAVALAADSAVTVRNRRGQKVYNFANKLFQLSKHHPIGIMIYGNAELSGIPWETIIKVYRNNLNDTLFDTLQEYCDHFFDFLQKEENYLFDKESIRSGIESAIFNYLKQVREELDFELQAHFEDEEQEDIRPDEIIEIIKKFIQEKKR